MCFCKGACLCGGFRTVTFQGGSKGASEQKAGVFSLEKHAETLKIPHNNVAHCDVAYAFIVVNKEHSLIL